jgi:hypothetical protein
MTTWEDQFRQSSQGPSQADQDRTTRIAKSISEALKDYPPLAARNIEVFPQGSFANRVNIPRESDVDICSTYKDAHYYELPPNRSLADYETASAATYSFAAYKNDVEVALVQRFGRANVTRGNKCIEVHNASHVVDADVVAAFEFYDYRVLSGGGPAIGTAMFSDNGKFITNFPQQQYDNGVAKHDSTNRRFKRQVRIQKSLRAHMEDQQNQAARPIKSFLLESLCWNVPNHCYGNAMYYQDFEEVMKWIYGKTETDIEAASLLEVNGIKRLIGPHSPWSRFEIRSYVESAWTVTH